MRVARKCTECRKLKSRLDFPKDNSHEGFGPYCNDCLFRKPELQILYNNLIIKTMPTLKEKREAEAAAKAAAAKTTTTETPVKKPAVTKPVAEKPLPKKGDTTEKGDTVVAEKKESKGRGRTAAAEQPIEQMDLETGKIVIATFNTAQEAADAVGTTKAYIVDALKGWVKSAAKFKWRYAGKEVFVREKKPKSEAEAKFKEGAPKPKNKKEVAPVVEDVPVPGDLDYDPELHAPQPEVEEEEELDESVFEEESEETEE